MNDEHNFYPILKRILFQRSRGRGLKQILGQPPQTPNVSPSACVNLLCLVDSSSLLLPYSLFCRLVQYLHTSTLSFHSMIPFHILEVALVVMSFPLRCPDFERFWDSCLHFGFRAHIAPEFFGFFSLV